MIQTHAPFVGFGVFFIFPALLSLPFIVCFLNTILVIITFLCPMADTLAHNAESSAPGAMEQRVIIRTVRDIIGTPDDRVIIFMTPQDTHITHITVHIFAQNIFTAACLVDTVIGNGFFEDKTAAKIVPPGRVLP